jgi:hypothetical protein
MPAASVSGITAAATPDDHVPSSAWTLLTSISFVRRAHAGLRRGLGVLGEDLDLASATPPSALTSPAAMMIAFCIPPP